MTGATASRTPALPDLRGAPARRRREAIVRGLFVAAAGTSVLISLLILLAIAGEAWSFISRVDLAVLVSDGWFPRRGRFDIATILAGTLVISAVGMLIATPLGLGA